MNIWDGQDRRKWLDGLLGEYVVDPLNYYLGPTGIPERAQGVAGLLEFTDAGDMPYAAEASRNLWNHPSLGNAAEYAAAGAALALPMYSHKMSDGLFDLADELAKGYNPNQVNIFAGVGAKNADTGALSQAKKMAEGGADRDEIWKKTGWFKGADDKWRFEIDDSGSEVTDRLMGVAYNAGDARGRDVKTNYSGAMAHKGLSDAYDMWGDVDLRHGRDAGSYYPADGRIIVQGDSPPGMRSTLLHETQHDIQGREGFASGSSPGAMKFAHMQLAQRVSDHLSAASLIDEVERNGGDLGAALRDFADLDMPVSSEAQELARRFGDSKTARQAADEITAAKMQLEPLRQPGQWQQDAGYGPYFRTAGEVEARNVQARRNMTAADRRATPPWQTQDVPEAAQISIFGDELQLSAPQRTPAQQEAQGILDMLTAGRAGEVTDDMMAAADDMYLFDNYDLPMDEASRLARADEHWPRKD